MGAAAAAEDPQGVPQGSGEAGGLGGVERGGGPVRVEAGPPEELVDEEVAEPGDAVLVEQDGLERAAAPRQELPQLGGGDGERVDAEPVLVGVELDRAEPSGVARRVREPPSPKWTVKRCQSASARLLA